MNKVVLMGRLTRDPDVNYKAGDNASVMANYTLAVDRRFKRDGDQSADFIRCITFGKNAEFTDKYLKKGMKIVVCGRIQTGSYKNKDGQTVYTTDVIVEEQDFAESKNSSAVSAPSAQTNDKYNKDNFMNIPDDADGELPF